MQLNLLLENSSPSFEMVFPLTGGGVVGDCIKIRQLIVNSDSLFRGPWKQNGPLGSFNEKLACRHIEVDET